MFSESTAEFSPDRQHRYTLKRVWQPDLPIVAFIGLNPSTADEVQSDPTVTRCINYAKAWDFGAMYMLNIFAYRGTDPKVLRMAADPVGPLNNQWLVRIAEMCHLVVACWGNHGLYLDRQRQVLNLLKDQELYCLKITKAGCPSHPLYLKKTLTPIKFS